MNREDTEKILGNVKRPELEEIRRPINKGNRGESKASDLAGNIDEDAVLMGSERSSKCAMKHQIKPGKQEESPYRQTRSPFADMIDSSLCEYLGNQSFVSNPSKSGNLIRNILQPEVTPQSCQS